MDTSRRPHILLVDDDISTIQVLWCMLSDEAQIRFAKSAEQALALAQSQPPDLILLDLELPDGSGLDLCRLLQQDRRLAGVPVMIVTAHARDDLQVAALEAGAVDFIPKPLQAAQLLARVRAQLRQRPGPEAPATAAPTPLRDALRVLIVDDDVVAIKMLRNALEAMPVQFHFATRGEEALKLAAQVHPDVILLDAQLPGLDGFEVCRRLKLDPTLADTPVIFVTRADDPLTEALALDAGAVDFIGKPYRPAVLKARVQRALQPPRSAQAGADAQGDGAAWQRWAARRVGALAQAHPQALLLFDAADRLDALNPAAQALLGVEPADVLGLGPGALWRRLQRPGDDAERPDEAALPGPCEERLCTLQRRDGSRCEVLATLRVSGEDGEQLTTLSLQPLAPGPEAATALDDAPTRRLTLERLLARLRRAAEALQARAAGADAPLQQALATQARLLRNLEDLLGLGPEHPAPQCVAVDLADCLRRAGLADTRSPLPPGPWPAVASDAAALVHALRRLATLAPAEQRPALDLGLTVDDARLHLQLQHPAWTWQADAVRRLRWPLPGQADPGNGSDEGHDGGHDGSHDTARADLEALDLAVTHHLLTALGADLLLDDAPARLTLSLPRWGRHLPDAPPVLPD
ncbi:MAG: response regulator [Burkholderiaceae bacterium]|nr:response regulator [Burkholderiaceae bacterium]